MTINFHLKQNQGTYASRSAQQEWLEMIKKYVHIADKNIIDLGCGGGIYSKALVLGGAKHVTAVDFSAEMLKAAQRNCAGIDRLTFRQGDALHTR